ncbi:NAD(P)H-binding protein [Psychromonas sp. MME2]|uniref:NAD(P)H-binding protein n=1 Tax=unclassified Psychromonas TaxID=2614957 RepID=UPI00339C22AA
MKQTISILGSGWLGVPVAKRLLKRFAQVKISTRTDEKMAHLAALGLQPYLIDIENLQDNIDPFLNSDILLINITSKNVAAFALLLEKIEQSSIQKLLFISSTGVYPNNSGLCKESDDLSEVLHPLLTIESLFRNSRHFQTTILRFAGLIGGRRHPGRFFATTKVPAKTISSAQAPVNLIHLDDCVEMIEQIIKREVWGEVLNGCADTHPTKAQFYTHNALALGLEKPRLSDDSAINKVVCNDKVKALLDYQFIHPDLMQIDDYE